MRRRLGFGLSRVNVNASRLSDPHRVAIRAGKLSTGRAITLENVLIVMDVDKISAVVPEKCAPRV